MRDFLEIEGKFRVPSHQSIKQRLQELHIPCTGIEIQRDIYYASPHRDFGASDEALRVRYDDHQVLFTYKGPRHSTRGLKTREEVNVPVASGKNLETILQRLGFTAAYTVEKQRERYILSGAEVSLDTVVDLGTFVEIEVIGSDENPEEKIEAIKKELGITGEHIPQSYLELLLKENVDRSVYPSPLH